MNRFKVDDVLLKYCETENIKKIPVIIFAEGDKELLRSKIISLGGTIRGEMKVLRAFSAFIYSKDIPCLTESHLVGYIAPSYK